MRKSTKCSYYFNEARDFCIFVNDLPKDFSCICIDMQADVGLCYLQTAIVSCDVDCIKQVWIKQDHNLTSIFFSF